MPDGLAYFGSQAIKLERSCQGMEFKFDVVLFEPFLGHFGTDPGSF